MAPTIAYFGATGGSTVACLALALEAGYDCSACQYAPDLSVLWSNATFGSRIAQSVVSR